jgi:serine protease AprX
VQGTSVQQAAAAVRLAGGRVVRELGIVDGVAATLPAGAQLPGLTVTADRRVASASVGDYAGIAPANVYPQEVQADNNGGPARSVTVAIIDTGVAPVGGLADNLLQVPDPMHQSQLAACANFSAEDTCADSYGHGTFLAGLIAGDGAYPGLDPNARLVSVKIAGRDGAADTSQLLAAIQYVVSFKDQLGIKVLNLSLGTDSDHDARKDPLNRAVERAWQAGITVVVAASNRGHEGAAGTISKPADDPLVITVGAVDDRGTTTRNDDSVPAFTAQGPVRQGTASDPLVIAKPDVVAPGVGLVSLVAPGSHIEQTAPPSTVGVSGYRRGSGTSQSTAVVSAAAAILLERRDWTPDQVKSALVRGAYPVAGAPATLIGAGLISVSAALGTTGTAAQAIPRQDALDAGLDPTRRGVLVTSFSCSAARAVVDGDDCVYVHGRLTSLAARSVQGPNLLPFDGAQYVSAPWTGQSWYSSQWMQGQSWYGQSWYGQSWYGQSWYEDSPRSTSEGTSTDFGTVLPGSTWYGVWR